jgi:hypothetical protein
MKNTKQETSVSEREACNTRLRAIPEGALYVSLILHLPENCMK